MPQEHTLKIVARMRSDFADKFGIPRQSGLVPALEARVVFEPEYRDPEGGAHTTGGYSMRNDREAPGNYEFEYILEGYPWDSAQFTLSFTHAGSLDLAIPLGDS